MTALRPPDVGFEDIDAGRYSEITSDDDLCAFWSEVDADVRDGLLNTD